ncbi:MAG: TIGR03435 family protein [Bryobacteraceae bacterium]
MHRIVLLFAAFLAVCPLSAQGTAPAKEFEVVSIRPVEELTMEERLATVRSRQTKISPDSVRMPYETMTQILQRAFGLAKSQVVAPDWTELQHFSIAAKLPGGATQADVPEMLKHMLSARFHLAYQTEVKNTRALVLTVQKSGVKAEKAAESPLRTRPIPHLGYHYELATTSAGLANFLKRVTFFPVIDRTGLLDSYLFSFDFYPFGKLDADGKPPEPPASDLITSYCQHLDEALAPLGLRVALSKADLENVIIDHLDRQPTEN